MKLSGIRLHLLLLGIGPTFFLVSVLAFYFIENRIDDLEQSLNDRGNIIARQAATASVYGISSHNKLLLQDLANTILLEKDVVAVRIVDTAGRELASTNWVPQPDKSLLLSFQSPVVVTPIQNKAKNIDSDELAYFFLSDSGTDSRKIGRVEVQLSLASTLESQRTFLFNSLMITASGLLITVLLALRLGMLISKPITKLTGAVKEISEGNMNARADFIADSELEELRQGFNSMAIGLQKTQQYLEQQVDNATNQLRFTLKSLEQKNRSLENARRLAVAQNKIKSQFLAHISHEIRTPMSGIIGFADLLSKTNLIRKQAEQIRLVKNSATNLMTIVNEILDHSSLESGKFKITSRHSTFTNAWKRPFTYSAPRRIMFRSFWISPPIYPPSSITTRSVCSRSWAICWAMPSSLPGTGISSSVAGKSNPSRCWSASPIQAPAFRKNTGRNYSLLSCKSTTTPSAMKLAPAWA